MDDTPSAHLLAALRACGLYPAGPLAAAEAALRAAPDLAAAADALQGAGVITDYQLRKLKYNRLVDVIYGPYLILDKIGEGGMGKVYKAVETNGGTGGGRLVALKTIRPHLMTNKVVVSRYKREGKAVKALNHPNVVTLYDADEAQGRYFLAMEFVDGIDLARLMKEFGHPPQRGLDDFREAAEYVRQAALGLQAAHDRGFVHRDIKPSNLLVSGERPLTGTAGRAVVKILDMGLVRVMAESEEMTGHDLTRDGTVVGTPDYMAPEQAKNSSTVDHRADLYALGCTLYFLLRGQPPFPSGTAIEKLLAHQTDAPPDLARARPDLPAGLAAVAAKLLQKKPADRYQSATEVAAVLAPFTTGGAAGNAAEVAAVPRFEAFSLEPDPPSAEIAGPAPRPRPAGPKSARLPGPSLAPGSAALATPVPEATPPRVGDSGPRPAAAARPAGPRLRVVSAPQPAGGRPAAGGPAPPPSGLFAPTAAADGSASGRLAPVGSASGKLPPVVPAPPPAGPATPPTGARRPPARAARPAKRPAREVSAKGAVWLGVAAGAVAVAAGLAVVRPWRLGETAATTGSAEAPPPTRPAAPPPAHAHLPPVARVLPPGAVAALVADPRPYWGGRGRYDANLTRPLPDFVEKLAKRAMFDPRTFDRLVVAFTAGSPHALAVGEGPGVATGLVVGPKPPPLYLPDADEVPAGLKLFDHTPKNGKRQHPWPRFLGATGPNAVAASDHRPALLGWAGRSADPPHPALAGLPDAGRAADPPFVAFAAAGPWPVPGGKPLAESGVERASAVLRFAGDGFELSVVAAGRDVEKLRAFRSSVYNRLGKNPSLAPIARALGEAGATTGTAPDGLAELRLTVLLGWDAVDPAVEYFVTGKPAEAGRKPEPGAE